LIHRLASIVEHNQSRYTDRNYSDSSCLCFKANYISRSVSKSKNHHRKLRQTPNRNVGMLLKKATETNLKFLLICPAAIKTFNKFWQNNAVQLNKLPDACVFQRMR